MTFMLGSWRRQQNAAKATNRGSLPPPPPLALQTSASGDTSSPETDENCSPPATPEGLRPRKSLHVIREELDLPAQFLEQDRFTALPPIQSPQITNSSFYSRDSSIMVAESPDLGQARTAVGALVAMSQGIVSHKNPRKTASDNRLGVLPPRTWEQQPELEEFDEDDDVRDVSYQRLQDSHEVWSPGRMRHSTQPSSPGSTISSSIRSSPPSWREWQHREAQRSDQHDVSFSSRVGLVENRDPLSYNFDRIDAPDEERQDYFVAPDHLANVSMLSQSTSANNGSSRSLDSGRYSSVSLPGFSNIEREEQMMEDALLQRKAKNQRRAKEQLLMGMIQRLQHDIELVAEVDALVDEEDQWFVKTPMGSEGLLTGFAKDTRMNLSSFVKSILHEMDVAQPEEFFLSPSQLESMADRHDDLREALIFLQGILQIAIPLSDQVPGQRWVCKQDIRGTMGITSIPESPETERGGDTSVFSLPSESTTPHTSNCSMATTITTKVSPYRRSNSRSSHESSLIRRTIEITSTLLQKMSVACHKLANRKSPEDSIRATEEIKRSYLQLMMLKNRDLRVVVDAFVVGTVEEAPIVRQVSSDEDQAASRQEKIVSSMPSSSHTVFVIGGKVTTPPCKDMFSPCTEDMNTIEPEYEEDDLRRQVGSNDYDDETEQRDAPEEDQRCAADPDVRAFYMGQAEVSTSCNK